MEDRVRIKIFFYTLIALFLQCLYVPVSIPFEGEILENILSFRSAQTIIEYGGTVHTSYDGYQFSLFRFFTKTPLSPIRWEVLFLQFVSTLLLATILYLVIKFYKEKKANG
jgi:hypothetical protein